MASQPVPDPVDVATDGPTPRSRRAAIAEQFERLVHAIRTGDEAMVKRSVLALSQRSRWLAPLAMVVGAFAMLFQGVKLLFTNWRLTLVQILPATWIWAAMLDLKAHALHGKQFHLLRGPLLWLVLLVIAGLMAGSFFLNGVFAFAISRPGAPEIRPGFSEAKQHLRTILAWGLGVGLALGFATMVVDHWGKFWFSLTLSIVVAIMMVAYAAVPARLIGVKVRAFDKGQADRLGRGGSGRVRSTVRLGSCRDPFARLAHVSLPGDRAAGRRGRPADRCHELYQGHQDERQAGGGQGPDTERGSTRTRDSRSDMRRNLLVNHRRHSGQIRARVSTCSRRRRS
jgi:hypothetical protein